MEGGRGGGENKEEGEEEERGGGEGQLHRDACGPYSFIYQAKRRVAFFICLPIAFPSVLRALNQHTHAHLINPGQGIH